MTPPFTELGIKGVLLCRSQRFTDARGWLVETWRDDWTLPPPSFLPPPSAPSSFRPAMSYVSVTCPGVARGPHEHREQTDCLGLVGPSTFRIFLWDNRKSSATFGRRLVLELGSADPGLLVIPPGVVHAYLNIGDCDGVVVNCPDRLYAGAGRSGPVDEIRHEHDPDSRFRLTADD